MSEALRVVITEDDRLYREGLETLLSAEPDVEIAGVFPQPAGLLEAARAAAESAGEGRWDIAVMDIEMPGINGIEATRELKRILPEVGVVILTVFEESVKILEAICAGADGYLLKTAGPGEIIEQLRLVAAGGSPLTPGVARTVVGLLRRFSERVEPSLAAVPPVELSDRELAVIRGLARGLSYKQVAADLEISIDSVRSYVRRLYRKLRVHSVTEAILRAMKSGLV